MSVEKVHLVALHLLPGIGPRTVKQLVHHFGTASEVVAACRNNKISLPGIGEKTLHVLKQIDAVRAEAEAELQAAEKLGCQIIAFNDPHFPQRLHQAFDAPSLLYYKGNADLNTTKIISIVGTRNATEYGKKITDQIVEELAEIDDLLIVSGLAYGIDICAHRAAVKHRIPTVGVMASGIDILYPSRHSGTAAQMLENGGLLTEERISTAPEAHRFPARNRIIAGMADATLVVEGAIKGGALITARIANSYNRDVFAIPGNVHNTYSAGCNYLIQHHEAHLVTNAGDICKLMNWDTSGSPSAPAKDMTELTPMEREIVELLMQREMEIDELSRTTTIPMAQLSATLLQLELQQWVTAMPGKKFSLA